MADSVVAMPAVSRVRAAWATSQRLRALMTVSRDLLTAQVSGVA
jgi:hypothetical protein